MLEAQQDTGPCTLDTGKELDIDSMPDIGPDDEQNAGRSPAS